jgi:formylglycine-generating enzyme required for sulfatase activity
MVPGGTFMMGDASAQPDERPAHPVAVSPFFIDLTEVTRGAYAHCVAAGACTAASTYPDEGGDDTPVVGVDWHQATAYCTFAGGRLPTEAEWEKAARGTDARTYPWGNELDCARGNFGNWRGEGYCAGAVTAPGHPVRVGSTPAGASPYGALDMAGNVWEWVADNYDANAYRATSARIPVDPVGPAKPDGDSGRVVRGGSCCSYFILPRTGNRLRFPPDYRDTDLGMRCAYTTEE